MGFIITGTFERRPVVLRWIDDPDDTVTPLAPHLDGDGSIVAMLLGLEGEPVPVTPTGPAVVLDLGDEWSTFCAARRLLGVYTAADEPEPPDGIEDLNLEGTTP